MNARDADFNIYQVQKPSCRSTILDNPSAGAAEQVEQLQRRVEELEILLRECHHRARNHLMLIVSLLSLEQHRDEPRCAGCQALEKTQQRVQAMAAVHERLSRAAAETPRDLAAWLRQLASEICRLHGLQSEDLQLAVHVDLPGLPTRAIMPCALIINELLTNCLKHAFPPERRWAVGEKPTVRLELGTTSEGHIRLTVADNGIGLPAGVEAADTVDGGWQLVKLLAGQLGGRMQLAGGQGTEVWVEFPATSGKGSIRTGAPGG